MVDIVKQMRYFKLALGRLLTKEVEGELKRQSESIYIEVSSDNESSA